MITLVALSALAAPAFIDQGFVLKSPATGSFAGGVNAPTIDIDNATATYVMYFESPVAAVSTDCINSYVIGRATSSDGLNWAIDASPVLAPDAADDNARCVVSQPSVVYDGVLWHLFYSSAREKPSSDADYNLPTGISYATSEDGVTFTVQAGPLIPATSISETVGLSTATIVNGQLYVMYFYENDFRIATASILDNTVWSTPTDTVLDHTSLAFSTSYVISPALFCEDDMEAPLSLVFAGDASVDGTTTRSLAFATSDDGTSWTMDAQTPLTGGDLVYSDLNHWDVIEAGDDYLLWYSKTDAETGIKAIGLASTSTPWGTAQPRLCPHEYQTNPPDTGYGIPKPDNDDTADTSTEGDKTGGCGCASSGSAPIGALGVLLGLLVRRRR